MNARIDLPPVPEPPHDPYSLLLAGSVGREPGRGWRWRDANGVEINAPSKALMLEPAPGVERLMTEPAGSFGGLRPPLNVALAPGGEVYLLDPATSELKRFDPCTCRFAPVPCSKDRVALQEARGLAICAGYVFVAESGAGRVRRYALDGFIPAGAVTLPRAERDKLAAKPWSPVALAFDGKGCLYVSDPRNLRIDRFEPGGRWLGQVAAEVPSWALAFDCRGVLHASIAPGRVLHLPTPGGVGGARWEFTEAGGLPAPYVARLAGAAFQRVDPRAEGARHFGVPPLAVDARGFLHFECCDGERIFDARGEALREEARSRADLYLRRGEFFTQALDSGIESCPWHRVELRGAIPPGCSVAVRTLCAEIALEDAELAGAGAWQEEAVALAMDGERWDCLVKNRPARYLWLKLDLRGDGAHSPRIDAIVLEYPRIGLRRHLPAVYGADPVGADFTDRFTAIYDRTLRSIEERLDRLPALFDPLSAPAKSKGGAPDFLSWIASWIGVAFGSGWPEARRRRYLKEVTLLQGERGTARGLRRQLLLFLGFDLAYGGCPAERPLRRCVPAPLNCGPKPALTPAVAPPLILEHFKLRRWLVAGRGHLGDDSVLWSRRIVGRSDLSGAEPPPEQSGNAQVGVSRLVGIPDPLRDPFHVFAHKFSVFVPARVRDCDAERRALEQLMAREAPAHTCYELRYVEPRFRVGVQAMLGLDSVIARTPRGVRLDGMPLGEASVLDAPPGRRGPRLSVGDARVGTTTVLT
jgi:phage tail-like protein